ncbi:ABC transporter substrate-binding protein [Roseateles aquatilis]|uniref:ABC transporter substrate-binding protein n=1 Tax=Roseateles aquatilis TaxID=431061 RepID=A0A246JD98_9BURK|nr:extracellular solute-binding protein [Roseateles aquatilis]OWQ90548.1 ABC transporter substrate-binding protein [Roseateles aquatilis]
MSRRALLRTLPALCGPFALNAVAQGAPTAPALAALIAAARKEGRVHSLGMPDDWANWRATWADLQRLYGLAHVDTDMSSAEEIAKMEAEKANASADIGDVGFEFGPIAKARGITQPYKPSTWAQVPDWAKDAEGHWALAYTGTIAFAVHRKRVPQAPRSWQALFASNARVLIGEVGRAAQSNAAVLAAAVALGGDETRLQPALAAFAKLAKDKRLVTVNATPALMERAEADVFLLWDFNALSYRAKLPNADDYEVLIPSDGSITSGYSTLINRYAPHPNAAMLTREFIFSDAGQLNLARGHARPIRIAQLTLPPDLKSLLVPEAQYAKARALKPAVWTEEVKKLPRAWQRDVLGAAR